MPKPALKKESKSYTQKRLDAIEISKVRNTIKLYHPHNNLPFNFQFFSEDKEGNMLVNYATADGRPYLYDGRTQFSRIRFPDAPQEKRYKQPYGTDTPPFVTPLVIKAFKGEVSADTLYLTEGELKAFALDNFGLHAIGIGGIFNFKEKNDFVLHEDIGRIIEKCKYKNVVLLFDADCLKVEWKEGKDLYYRLNQFYSAVRQFNELTKPLNFDLYFSHVSEVHELNAKGIDDLLYHKDTVKKEVIKELQGLTAGSHRNYIKCLLITGNANNAIQKYFSVDSVNTFFENYRTKIEGHDFVYKKETWFIDEAGKLKISWYGEAASYIRVGCDFYKRIYVKNAHGKSEMVLKSWKIAEINRDYKNSKIFIDQISKYDAFCNIPDHTDKYQRIIQVDHDGIRSKLYNRYHPISHVVADGEWPTIQKFLTHIFNYTNVAGENLYEFGLDYIQLLYTQPTQRLPVLCPVSYERNTGKSTFLEFLRLIFKENCTILDNERFTGKFTSHFTDKLVIGLDEGFIPIEQKLMKERIKNMSTGRKSWLEAKSKDAEEIDYFGKLILCSNDEKNFMQIDSGENRFAVIKIAPLEKDDPMLLQKMEAEIGHFIFFLLKRKLHYKGNISRFWFDTDVYLTKAMQVVVERTKARFEKELEDMIKEHFFNYKVDYLHYAIIDIIKLLKDERNYNFADAGKLKDYLIDSGKSHQRKGIGRYNVYSINPCITDIHNPEVVSIEITSKPGRPFGFYYKDWLSKSEIIEFEELCKIDNNNPNK